MTIYFQDRDGQTPLSPEERKGLKSKLVTLMGELDALEQANINKGLLWLKRKSFKSCDEYLNVSFSNDLHKKLYGEVWNWAGSYRKSEKNIGIDPHKITIGMHNFFEDVKIWVDQKAYPERELLARFHHRLVHIHPYPNGNGRFSRILTNLLSKELLGRELSWYSGLPAKERRDQYIGVLREADIKNYQPIIEYFEQMDTAKPATAE